MRFLAARTVLKMAALSMLAGCTAHDFTGPGTQLQGQRTPQPAPREPTAEPISVDPAPPREPQGGFVRPEEFGAVGDGVTDDTAALQAAVDAAAGADARVVLGATSTYLLNNRIDLPSGTFLTGGTRSVLQFTWRYNDSEHDGYYLGNRDQKGAGNTDITLEGFTIRGAAPGVPAGPKKLQVAPNVPAIRLRLVDRFRIARLDVGYAPGISIIHQGCSNGTIVDNHIHHAGRDGINSTWHHRNMHDILIADNVISKVGDDGIAVIGAPGNAVNRTVLPRRVLVRDNVIQGWPQNPNGLALGRGIAVLAATRVRLEGNVIDRTHSAGILVAPSTRTFSIDPQSGARWRSSHIQITQNRIVGAGQNFVGSDSRVDVPSHTAILVKSSDTVHVWDNEVIRPFGEPVTFFDCRRCVGEPED